MEKTEGLRKVLESHGVFTKELFTELTTLLKSDTQLPPFEERRQVFIESIKPYTELLGREDANNFFQYWSAKTPRSKLMAWERQKSWCLEARINTWIKNKQKFSIVGMLSDKKKRQTR